MDESIKKHIEQVNEWLEKNVQVFSEPKTVRLSEFSINWADFRGTFRVAFDNVVISESMSFGLEASGKTTFYLPMFHSPLGAPASYAAIEITENTRMAILKGLWETLPRLEGAGINRETGKKITYHTPPKVRIDTKILKIAKEKVTTSYLIDIAVKNV